MKFPLQEHETPSVLLDEVRLQNNIQRMQALANQHGLALRPHGKTHKCLEIAHLQVRAGAVGITSAKTDEAITFINGGVNSVTVAYPLVVDCKVDRLLEASQAADVRLIVDSLKGAEVVAAAAGRSGRKISVFLKIDVGLHRCGFQENDPALLEVAQWVDRAALLNLRGLLSHAGHSYGAKSREEIKKAAQNELDILTRIRRNLSKHGIDLPEISVGSTPTVLASDTFEGITEIRPGNYVFMDRMQLNLGVIEPDQIALSVLATVVSANADYFIIDAGSKVLTSDQAPHGSAGLGGFGLAYPLEHFQEADYQLMVVRLSEEHGFVERGDYDLPIGSLVRIVPNHACVVANLRDTLTVIKEGSVIDYWRVAARGQSQ